MEPKNLWSLLDTENKQENISTETRNKDTINQIKNVAQEKKTKPEAQLETKANNQIIITGYGPRYLHSTGQLQKGGPRNICIIYVYLDLNEQFRNKTLYNKKGQHESRPLITLCRSLRRTR